VKKEKVKKESGSKTDFVLVSIAKLRELLLKQACTTCSTGMRVVQEKGTADITILLECSNKPQHVWNLSNKLPCNENKKYVKTTPL
jgi:hypothetical protein